MLEFLKRHGREHGLIRIFLCTNQDNVPAMELYRKTGARRPNRDDVLLARIRPDGRPGLKPLNAFALVVANLDIP